MSLSNKSKYILNEYSKLTEVAIRNPQCGFISEKKIFNEWEALRYHS